ncbi:MAG: hypothetical protein AB8B59_03220 [Maribacter sp.]
MKNTKKVLWQFSVVSILLAFNLMSCGDGKQKPGEENPKTNKQSEKEIAGEPKGIISLDEAKVLCDNYESRRLKSIIEFEMAQKKSDEKFLPTQFIDFELKTIKKYIKYVEHYAEKAKIKPDSLRIYLGNYGPDGKDTNKNTVFILPTATIDGNHGGFFINANGNAELIRNYWPEDKNEGQQKSEASFFPSLNVNLYNDRSFILNYGQGGPPPPAEF